MTNKANNQDIIEQVNKHFTHSAHTYYCGAQLQKQVGRNLQSYLDRDAELMLDLGAGPGLFTQSLSSASKQLISLDLSPVMLNQHQNPSIKVNADGHALPFVESIFDNVFSSLMIQWCDFPVVIEEMLRVLKPGKKATISTLVSGTLLELEQAWAEIDSDQHIHQYLDREQIESMLNASSCQRFNTHLKPEVLYFDTVYLLAKELKQLGANYVKDRKNKGLVTKSKWQKLESAYSQLHKTEDGVLPATYQVLYIEMVK